jgi:hypothetical protein
MAPYRTVVSLLFGVTFVAATTLSSAEILAEAGGKVYSTKGDQSVTTGAPTAASADYTHPFGRFVASAAAQVGALGATANLYVAQAPGYLDSAYPYYGETYALGFASFYDTWFISGEPAGTVGQLRVTSHFEGAADGSAINAVGEFFGRYTLQLSAMEAGTRNPVDNVEYASGDMSVADETITLNLTFHHGAPIIVQGYLLARVELLSKRDAYSYSGGGDANFGNTAELTRLEVMNENGEWVPVRSFETESKQLYPFQNPAPNGSVPEPGTVALMLIGIALIAARRKSWASRLDL